MWQNTVTCDVGTTPYEDEIIKCEKKKNKGTIECDESTVTCDVSTAQCEAGTIKCEKKNKGTTECDKSIVTCDVSTALYETGTIKCDLEAIPSLLFNNKQFISVTSQNEGKVFVKCTVNTKTQKTEKAVRIGVLGASGYTGSEDLPDMVAIKDANFSDVDAKPLCTQYVGRYHPAYKGNDFNRDGDEMVPLTEMVMKWCLWDEVRHYIEEDEKLTIYMKWSNFAAGKMYPSESLTPVDGIYFVSPALFRSKSAILRS
ncbi:hypothetical protein SO802_026511 [Lithocarpus litseifolius]|uniref:Uncharacterized protein n=1 Tax=Lithocarpus litseifolius TaxID=425828 RepID=A0AAW2C1K5_9ROSI